MRIIYIPRRSVVIDVPTVTTNSVTSITSTTAVSGGNVTSDGGAEVTEYGVEWSLTSDFSSLSGYTSDGSGLGSFVSDLTGLSSNTLYYVRAYAVNSTGTGYGGTESFTSDVALTEPIVSTYSATSVGSTFATYNGSVDDDGGSAVTIRGFVIIRASLGDPSVTNYDTLTNNGTGVGSYSTSEFGLLRNTNYAYRAYALNSTGYGYGGIEYFTTLP